MDIMILVLLADLDYQCHKWSSLPCEFALTHFMSISIALTISLASGTASPGALLMELMEERPLMNDEREGWIAGLWRRTFQ